MEDVQGIVDRERVALALWESELRFRQLVESLPQLVWSCTSEGCGDYLNPQWCAYTGKPLEEQLGFGWLNEVHPDDRDRLMIEWAAVVPTGQVFDSEVRIRRFDGQYRWFKTRATPIFDESGRTAKWFGSNTDIQAMKEAEEALRVSEASARALAAELKALMESMPGLTFVAHDPDCRRMTSSPGALELLRLRPDSNPSKSAPDVERPTSFRLMRDGRELSPEELPVQMAASTGRAVRNAELTLRFEDGDSLEICGDAVPLFDESGEIRGAVGTFIDITERKKVEKALRTSEARFRKLFESDLLGIGVPDRFGGFAEANNELLRIVGYTRDDLEAGLVRWDKMTPPEYQALDQEHIIEAAGRGFCTPYEKEYIRKDGSRVPILCGYALLDDSEDQYIGFVQDLSQRKRAEEALRQAEKLATAGRFAASMAHEINNPLAAVVNSIYLALRDDSLSPQIRECLTLADRELLRVSRTVSQTLKFHRQLTAPTSANIPDIMEDVFSLFATRLRAKNIALHREHSLAEPLYSFGDDLRHAFANLVSNALDAMAHGGRLRTRIRAGSAWDGTGRRGVRVTVADTGPGIPALLKTRIFQPFVTTKEATGTGLGLWVVEGVVRKHRGSIMLRSATTPAQHGTVFSIFLPFDGVKTDGAQY